MEEKFSVAAYFDKPTRTRGGDEPHIFDLVLTNDSFIDNIEYLAPLVKSDHSVLNTAVHRYTESLIRTNTTIPKQIMRA